MYKAYRYRIYPTVEQADWLVRSMGCARWVYNWALAEKIAYYQATNKGLSCFDLMGRLPQLKRENEWLKSPPAQSLQQEVSHLDTAFTNFFKKNGGFPRFKKKGSSRSSFSCPQDCYVEFESNLISIPKCKNIKARLSRPFTGAIKKVTVTRTKTGNFYASVLVDDGKDLPAKCAVNEATAVGVDVGIKDFAVFSTGEKIANPKHLAKSEARLKVLQRRMSKKQKGSANRNKARLRLARLHERIASQRKDFHHKISTRLVRENQTVIVEDLNVKGMVRNHHLAKAISDVGWDQFKEFLRYKCDWYGKNLVEINRFLPSSKMCSCGVINESLTLAMREWTCDACKVTHDRDILAAQNIKRWGLIPNA